MSAALDPASDLAALLAALTQQGVVLKRCAGLAPAHLFELPAAHWGQLARAAKAADWRWVALWGDEVTDSGGAPLLRVNASFAKAACYLVARTTLPGSHCELASHTPFYPGADRPERHTHDLLGIVFQDHPDARRWTRHQAWNETEFPLRSDFVSAPSEVTPADHAYSFLQANGSGVYEIPVGPVHAGIIEPGHFRFQAVGETVLRLEERLGYTHKGIEKCAVGRCAVDLARLAARVSGDSTVAHSWAACMAMEHAAALEPPPRALALRALLCERERIANHIGDMGAMLNDIGFAFGAMQFARLREAWQRVSKEVFGHRFMMDCIVPGGVAVDLSSALIAPMRVQGDLIQQQIKRLMAVINDLPSVADRVRGAGVLKSEIAQALGCLGYVGRASGVRVDVRRDAAYAPYDRLNFSVPLHHYGDVNARARTRLEEITASFEMIEDLLDEMPSGPIRRDWIAPAENAEGLGLVEGWRGEILSYVRFGSAGRVARFFPRDPSWTTWPALELLMHDNIVPDFPICNKSVNGSYSGVDL